MRIERIVLEDHGDVAVLRRQFVDDDAADGDFTGGDVLQSGDHAQQRALAAAGGSDQHQELVVGDVQIDTVNDFQRAEALDHPTKTDLGQPPLLEP